MVVVGAGLGGLRSAEGLRRAGFEGEIVLVGEEAHRPYSRPPLSKEVLAGEVTHERVAFPLRASITDVRWRTSTRAVALDVSSRTVALDDGEDLAFDGLVVATGLRPRRLDLPGPPPDPAAGRHVVRTLDDAAAVRAQLGPGARVVVIGAGFIGCEVAATARGLGCAVTVVAIDPFPMVRPLGPLLGAELQRRHEAQGVEFRLGVGVRGFAGGQRVAGVELTDGAVLPADVVVEAVGSHCNTEWLTGCGLDLADGVLTDSVMRGVTTEGRALDGVHAVGDLARFPNPLFDEQPRRVEHWNIPTETAKRAAPALAAYLSGEGYDHLLGQRFAPMPSFWSDQYDTRLQSFGLPDLADPQGVEVLEGEISGEAVLGYLRGPVLVGVVSLGLLQRALGYRPLIGRPVPAR